MAAQKITQLLLTVYYFLVIWNRRTLWLWWKGLKLPPGPPRLPIVKNKYQLPLSFPWLKYTEWSKLYGPIVSFEVFNGTTILLNNAKVASDLLDARSSKYSGRPAMQMAKLAGRGKSLLLMDADDPRFNPYRKLVQTGLSPTVVKKYRPIQTEVCQTLLKDLAEKPELFREHIRRMSVALIMKVVYGYSVTDKDDRMVKIIEDGLRNVGPINIPGRYLVETMPILRFLPDWFPGAGFKRHAKDLKKLMDPIQTAPFHWAIDNISTGKHVESYVSHHIHIERGNVQNDEASQDAIQWTASSFFVAGGDTVVAVLTSFICLMCAHPRVQKKAQAYIDTVAPHRLPTLDDLDSLPYIVAIIKEVVRWATVSPLALPHKASQDDVYEGYFIPKGATVYPNNWAIAHDEDAYPDPFLFNPERHLGPDPQPDPFKFVFGFGRRICPGAHFAQMSLFLNAMTILAVFDILKPLDENGVEVEPIELQLKSGVTLHMEPIPCRIKPRSPEHLVYMDKV